MLVEVGHELVHVYWTTFLVHVLSNTRCPFVRRNHGLLFWALLTISAPPLSQWAHVGAGRKGWRGWRGWRDGWRREWQLRRLNKDNCSLLNQFLFLRLLCSLHSEQISSSESWLLPDWNICLLSKLLATRCPQQFGSVFIIL